MMTVSRDQRLNSPPSTRPSVITLRRRGQINWPEQLDNQKDTAQNPPAPKKIEPPSWVLADSVPAAGGDSTRLSPGADRAKVHVTALSRKTR
jgi:hypothetical protein